VDDRAGVLGDDLDGCVHLARCRATNQERHAQAALLHLLRDSDHLVQRGRDEARQPDDVSFLRNRRVQDLLHGHHDANVHHSEVVAAQHDGHNVLADVVHVALHRGDQKRARVRALCAGAAQPLLLLHEGHQVAHRLLHHARALDYLRQEHLARAEKVAHDVHRIHQRALDDVQRLLVQPAGARLLRVAHAELVDAL